MTPAQALAFLQDRDALVQFYEPNANRAYLVDVEIHLPNFYNVEDVYVGEGMTLEDACARCKQAWERQKKQDEKSVEAGLENFDREFSA